MSTVRITRIIPNWDMRIKHKLREGRAANKLKSGEVLVAFNRRRTQARLIDSAGGVHDYYVETGQFDIGALKDMVKSGFHLDLTIGRSERIAVVRLGLAA